MYATAATVLLAAITVLAGIAAVHAQAGGADMVANDDTAVSNGIDQLAIDILANDTFEGPVSVTVESRYVWPDIAQNPPPRIPPISL